MVEVSRIDNKNGSRSIFIENNITNAVLHNFFRVKKSFASRIILDGSFLGVTVLGGNCLGGNCPRWELSEGNCPGSN